MMLKFPIDFSSPSQLIREGWVKLKKIPAGSKIFSSIVSRIIPYTGSISPKVIKIENGHAIVLLKDKRAVRNHLNSIHAIALANLGEFSTGLSLMSQLPKNGRVILVKLEVSYFKKARGDIIADASFELPQTLQNENEFQVTSNITNSKQELVSRVIATWNVRLA